MADAPGLDLAAFARGVDRGAAVFGVPIYADRTLPEGEALLVDGPQLRYGPFDEPAGPRARHLLVGIPSRNATEAALIVREGMADVLGWLGQPVYPLALDVATAHYGVTVRVRFPDPWTSERYVTTHVGGDRG